MEVLLRFRHGAAGQFSSVFQEGPVVLPRCAGQGKFFIAETTLRHTRTAARVLRAGLTHPSHGAGTKLSLSHCFELLTRRVTDPVLFFE